MFNYVRARMITGSLLLPFAMTVACDRGSPSAPSRILPPEPPPLAALTVTAVSPNRGVTLGGTLVTIDGTGFDPGATVTLEGVATNATVNSSRQIVAQTSPHAGGSVDVVVTNPNGPSARLTGGFTYAVFTLTVTPNTAAPGGLLSVSWVAQGAVLDWVALFKVGEKNESYGWWEYTRGASSGTLTLTAPAEAGQYEFRYLLDDDYIDVVRSSPVTVK